MGLHEDVADILDGEDSEEEEKKEKQIDTTKGKKGNGFYGGGVGPKKGVKITSMGEKQAAEKKGKAASNKAYIEDAENKELAEKFAAATAKEPTEQPPNESEEDSDVAPMPSIVDKKRPLTAEEERLEKI